MSELRKRWTLAGATRRTVCAMGIQDSAYGCAYQMPMNTIIERDPTPVLRSHKTRPIAVAMQSPPQTRNPGASASFWNAGTVLAVDSSGALRQMITAPRIASAQPTQPKKLSRSYERASLVSGLGHWGARRRLKGWEGLP